MHFEGFIAQQIQSGRYGSASEVVRDALRHMEVHKVRLAAPRAHLAEGAAQARRGEFVEDYSLQRLLAELDREA